MDKGRGKKEFSTVGGESKGKDRNPMGFPESYVC